LKQLNFSFALLPLLVAHFSEFSLEVMEGVHHQRGIASRKGPTSQDWETWRPTIEFFYINKDLTLSRVVEEMEQQGFFAT
jgi:hypothetical protein